MANHSLHNNSSTTSNEPLDKNFTRGTFGKRSTRKINNLRKSFRNSFRRRKDLLPSESTIPHQWKADESDVRSGTCSFEVKYLGCVEVFESVGTIVCEEALTILRNSRRRAVQGLLHISGDGLRVVDDERNDLIVDQTNLKISFCAPDRNHERGFSYICLEGTTRRWMCHGFLASKDSGERLAHAVGCAFAVCLNREQRRDKECGVTMKFDRETSTFTRNGSFRTQSITERLTVNERGIDTPPSTSFNPFVIERPHASPLMLERQNSFRGFNAVGASSPFKRQFSLRINDLPSNVERHKEFLESLSISHRGVSQLPEVSSIQIDSVSQLYQELSQDLSKDDKNMATSFSQNLITNSSASTSKIASIAPFTTSPGPSSNSSQIVTAQISPRLPTDVNQRVVPPIETVNPLPNPEQCLGNIASIAPSSNSSQIVTAQISPRQHPSIPTDEIQRVVNHCLEEVVEIISTPAERVSTNPFDVEWTTPVVLPEVHSTNPFI